MSSSSRITSNSNIAIRGTECYLHRLGTTRNAAGSAAAFEKIDRE